MAESFDRRHRCPVHVEPLPLGDGRNAWRVSRVFPNAASAQVALTALEQIHPEGFEPVGEVVPPEPAPVVQPEIVVDEDAPLPGCPSGLCGMD